MTTAVKLNLDLDEREQIEEADFRVTRLAAVDPEELAERSALPLERCEELVALSQFQTLGSVGPNSAEDLWKLGFGSLDSLRGADPSQMYRQLSRMVGQKLDPCVEDVFRCAVAQVNFPDLPRPLRQWWMWKEQRGQSEVVALPD
ncbi:MAG: hypothetical protein GY856_13145 [bacterium]|nr:hypothetical protein [bacterium]